MANNTAAATVVLACVLTCTLATLAEPLAQTTSAPAGLDMPASQNRSSTKADNHQAQRKSTACHTSPSHASPSLLQVAVLAILLQTVVSALLAIVTYKRVWVWAAESRDWNIKRFKDVLLGMTSVVMVANGECKDDDRERGLN